MTLLLGILTFLLVLVSLFMVLVILAQRTKSDGGVGAGLGGGMAEAAFGAESGNVLTTSTQVAAVAFFVLSFILFLGHIHEHRKGRIDAGTGLPGASEFAPAPVENPASATPPAPNGTTSVTPAPETNAPANQAVPSTQPAEPSAAAPQTGEPQSATTPQPAAPAPGETAQPKQ